MLEFLPNSLRDSLLAYAEDPARGVTPEMLDVWEANARRYWEAANAARATPKLPFPPVENLEERRRLAGRHLRGDGIEIGALHSPLPLPVGARARYVDLCDMELLELLYADVAAYQLVPVDVIDDGESLAKVPDASVDFVVSNHFLEHCEDPLGALVAQARVLRDGGVLYCSVPDCRFSFDRGRERTTLAHLIEDHELGPQRSRAQHYRDWTSSVIAKRELEFEAYWRLLDALDYSIHFHVWTPADVLDLFLALGKRGKFPLEIVDFTVGHNECILIGRKA